MKNLILIFIFSFSLVGCFEISEEKAKNHPYLSGLSLEPLCQNNLLSNTELIGKTVDAHYGLIKIDGHFENKKLLVRHGANITPGAGALFANQPKTIIEQNELRECAIKSVNDNTIYEMEIPTVLKENFKDYFSGIGTNNYYDPNPTWVFMYFEYIAAQNKLIPLVGNLLGRADKGPNFRPENFIKSLHPASPIEYIDVFASEQYFITAPTYEPKFGWACEEFNSLKIKKLIPTNEIVATFLNNIEYLGTKIPIANLCYKGTAVAEQIFVYDIIYDDKF